MGKKLGYYHYAGGGDPVAEADYFIDNIKGYIGTGMLIIDWEAIRTALLATRLGFAGLLIVYTIGPVSGASSMRPSRHWLRLPTVPTTVAFGSQVRKHDLEQLDRA